MIRRASRLSSGCAALLAAAAGLAPAARAQAPEVTVAAVSEYAAVRPGDSFRVAVRLDVPAGWHIGWVNPGASGLGTALAWRLPPGVSGGTTEWPYPEADESGADVLNVYRGTVVVFSTFATSPAVAGTLSLEADLSWGICRDVCIPQHRSVNVTVPVARAAARTSDWATAELATRRLPMREPGSVVTARRRSDGVLLEITGLKAQPAPGTWFTFFPLAHGRASVVAASRAIAGGIAVNLPPSVVDTAGRLAGVLVAAHASGQLPPVRALAVDAPLGQ